MKNVINQIYLKVYTQHYTFSQDVIDTKLWDSIMYQTWYGVRNKIRFEIHDHIIHQIMDERNE